jgi:hypothetical protein
MQPLLDEARRTLHARSIDASRTLFSSGAAGDESSIWSITGISGQTRFQNNTVSPFSYSVFDGFRGADGTGAGDRPAARRDPLDRVVHRRLFQAGWTRGLAAWEAAFGRSSGSIPRRSTRIRQSRARRRGCEPTIGRW